MGKIPKIAVCGMKGIGKTSLLHMGIFGTTSQIYPTIEDIYVANIDTDRGIREKIRFYDTAGLEEIHVSGSSSQQLPRHYISIVDGYVLMYNTAMPQSLDVLIVLRKDIEKNKDKKEVTIIVIAIHKSKEPDATISKATAWCNKEKIRHFVCNIEERNTLFEPLVYLANKLYSPPSKNTFTQLAIGRKPLNKD